MHAPIDCYNEIDLPCSELFGLCSLSLSSAPSYRLPKMSHYKRDECYDARYLSSILRITLAIERLLVHKIISALFVGKVLGPVCDVAHTFQK